MKTCSVDGCDHKYLAKGYCSKHYYRWKKYGNPKFPKHRSGGHHYLWSTYKSMKTRCYNINRKRYKDYGGRGISVCDRWLEPKGKGFWNFVEDMGPKPTQQHSLDRIDNDGNYEPGNCRWATPSEQTINQGIRKDNTSGHKGVRWYKKYNKWTAKISINKKSKHLGTFNTKEEAIAAREAAELLYYKNKL